MGGTIPRCPRREGEALWRQVAQAIGLLRQGCRRDLSGGTAPAHTWMPGAVVIMDCGVQAIGLWRADGTPVQMQIYPPAG
jgi:hypothetical protein